MWTVCFDCEGVLIPEIWIAVSEAVGLPELKRTTREEPDYDKLMKWRLSVLKSHGIKISTIREAVGNLEPLAGAIETLEISHSLSSRVILVTDTFDDYAKPLLGKLGKFPVFCHTLEVDDHGTITDYQIRVPDQKLKTVEALKSLNFKVLAVGDSFNDIPMLKSATVGILFNPSSEVQNAHPEIGAVWNHKELTDRVREVLRGSHR